MENAKENASIKFCKKIKFGDDISPTILLGIILSQDETFIVFRTGKRKVHINKQQVVSISDTNIIFKDENGGGSND